MNTRNNKYVFNSTSNNNIYSLLLIRFLLINNEEISIIGKEIEFSRLLISEYSNKEKYLYYINACLYKYFENDYGGAFDYILKIGKMLMRLILETPGRKQILIILQVYVISKDISLTKR